MGPDIVVDLFRQALQLVVMLVAVIVLPGLGVGLLISIFQAATQINEQTLSFIPRLLVTMLALIIFSPWLLKQMVSFTDNLTTNLFTYMS